MTFRKTLLILFFFPLFNLLGQELQYKVEAQYLFDNHERLGSNLAFDYTLSGVRLSPELGIRWDEKHHFLAGLSAISLSGSRKFIDHAKITAYYQYKNENLRFLAGSFSRGELLSDYSEFLFQDSLSFMNPTIQGLYLKKGDSKAFVKLFIDWNGWRTDTQRESFFIGASGYKEYKSFFLEFQSYLFHLANTIPSKEEFGVCDNFQSQMGGGVDLSDRTIFDKLRFSIGVLAGFERVRKENMKAYIPIGISLKSEIKYKYYGLDLIYYGGNARSKFYHTHGTQLYWSSPFLRANHYAQSKLYAQLFLNRFVKGELALKAHLSEKKIFLEQRFSLFVQLD